MVGGASEEALGDCTGSELLAALHRLPSVELLLRSLLAHMPVTGALTVAQVYTEAEYERLLAEARS